MTELELSVLPAVAPGFTDSAGRVHFHQLVYLDEGAETTVGRPGNGEFIVLPAEGAAVLRRLESGAPVGEVARWFLHTYGEAIDLDELIAGLDEVGFIRREGEVAQPSAGPLRWQRLGRIVFSRPVGVGYVLLLLAWLISIVERPALLPRPHNLFFTHYMSVLVITMFVVQIPLLLLHEAAHALAGRRLGLHTRLSIGRRMQFIVFETTMNGLVAVERGRRYLPILAGMMTDLGISAVFGLVAALTIRPDGTYGPVAAFALSLSFLTLLRFVWQFWFFLRTDVYYLVVTALGCVDLHTAAKQQLANQFRRLRGKPVKYDPGNWHPRDREVARWYAKLMFLGYAACVASLVFGWLPAVAHIVDTIVAQLFRGHDGWKGLLDSIVFLALNLIEISLVASMAIRQRTRRTPKG